MAANKEVTSFVTLTNCDGMFKLNGDALHQLNAPKSTRDAINPAKWAKQPSIPRFEVKGKEHVLRESSRAAKFAAVAFAVIVETAFFIAKVIPDQPFASRVGHAVEHAANIALIGISFVVTSSVAYTTWVASVVGLSSIIPIGTVIIVAIGISLAISTLITTIVRHYTESPPPDGILRETQVLKVSEGSEFQQPVYMRYSIPSCTSAVRLLNAPINIAVELGRWMEGDELRRR
ncbi:hypothetical protein HK102_004086, partial [Quaeritorhiza haematococci]